MAYYMRILGVYYEDCRDVRLKFAAVVYSQLHGRLTHTVTSPPPRAVETTLAVLELGC